MSESQPPFRAEHIGSLLRPHGLLALRAKFGRGEIGREALTAAENEAIKAAIALQERVGLKFASDGEFRRRSYHSFFYRQLGDISIDTVGGEDAKGGDAGKRGAQPVAMINSRVQWTKPINVDDFLYIKANTALMPKITIPGPCALHFRGGDAAVSGQCLYRRRQILGRHGRGLRPRAGRARRRRLPLRADRRDGLRQVRRSRTCRRRCGRAATTGAA